MVSLLHWLALGDLVQVIGCEITACYLAYQLINHEVTTVPWGVCWCHAPESFTFRHTPPSVIVWRACTPSPPPHAPTRTRTRPFSRASWQSLTWYTFTPLLVGEGVCLLLDAFVLLRTEAIPRLQMLWTLLRCVHPWGSRAREEDVCPAWIVWSYDRTYPDDNYHKFSSSCILCPSTCLCPQVPPEAG